MACGHFDFNERYRLPQDSRLQPYEVFEICDFPLAPIEALLRVHAPTYIAVVRSYTSSPTRNVRGLPSSSLMASQVQAAAAKLQTCKKDSMLPLTPLVQKVQGEAESSLKDPEVCDSRISAGSYAAARRAAGAVMHAIEQVIIPELCSAAKVVALNGS